MSEHRGGTAEAVELAPDYEETAIRAAQILVLRVAGVDMLETEEGPQVLEVNSSPGLEGIERATGIDVAAAIGCPRVTLLNDLESTAYGTLFLRPDELHTLHEGVERPGNRAVIAAGTG